MKPVTKVITSTFRFNPIPSLREYGNFPITYNST